MLCAKLLILFTGLTLVASRRHVHFYRKDYTFFEQYDGFYKIHWDLHGISWSNAFMACDEEGAQLFYPKEDGEWTVVKNLTDALPVRPNVTDIFVGIHDEFGLGEFITVDGHSTPSPLSDDQLLESEGERCVLMDIDTGVYKIDSCISPPPPELVIRPFACKRVDKRPCPTIDQEYIYQKEVKKCYKVHNRLKTWQEAMHTCYMEGGLLSVIGNDAEARILQDRVSSETKYFTGFRRIYKGGDFYTIKGQNLEESGYEKWYITNGYNPQADKQGDCGVVKTERGDLKYTTVGCDESLPFLCEMELRTS